MVTIHPRSKRASERCSKHGYTMILLKEDGNRFLVESLECTDKDGRTWKGWFTFKEASYEQV